MTELEKAWQNARSIESKEEHIRAAIIGRTRCADWIYVFTGMQAAITGMRPGSGTEKKRYPRRSIFSGEN